MLQFCSDSGEYLSIDGRVLWSCGPVVLWYTRSVSRDAVGDLQNINNRLFAFVIPVEDFLARCRHLIYDPCRLLR